MMGAWGAPTHVWKVVLTLCSGEAFKFLSQGYANPHCYLGLSFKTFFKRCFNCVTWLPQKLSLVSSVFQE